MKRLLSLVILCCLGCEAHPKEYVPETKIGKVVSIEEIKTGPSKFNWTIMRAWVVVKPGENYTATVSHGEPLPKVGETWLVTWGCQRLYNSNGSSGSGGYVFTRKIE